MQEKVRSSSNQKRKQSCERQTAKLEKIKMSSFPYEENTRIILGVCAMKKKVNSKPMKQILSRLKCQQIEILQMDGFLGDSWKLWPKVDALICFYSDGFPYLQAWKYVKRHKPFLINSLDKQQYLWDRTVIYNILKNIRVPIAKHYNVFRDLNYVRNIQERNFGPDFKEPEEKSQLENEGVKDFEQKFSNSDDQDPILKERHSSGGRKARQTSPIPKLRSRKHSQESREGGKNCSMKEMDSAQQPVDNDSIKSKAKAHKDNMFESSYPNALRSFHQSRSNIEYEVEEIDDYLLIKSAQKVNKLEKPFVQKPFDSENHQICVYYPESMGGGRKMLFRKIQNTCSEYQPKESSIRRDGNYIYEEFLPTNAFDIKVYTIGPYYMYAEARKAPTLDGVVERSTDGKEKRFPVNLTPDQKFICNKIVNAFGQEVCGFDLLRTNGKSYVCDVNGWSFVKGNPKYWDDCATILRRKIFKKFFPLKVKEGQSKYERFSKNIDRDYRPPMDHLSFRKEELRSIVAIFRHGDRFPKLKLKLKTSDPRFLQLMKGTQNKELKLKDAKSLTKILDIVTAILNQFQDHKNSLYRDYRRMKAVLSSGGFFQGINRKLQVKVIERAKEDLSVQKVLLVLKWGGELSKIGYEDALQLGKKMRMDRYSDDEDFLSLYSTYRHDLKAYSSDQGRCIKTAAAFLKGFLNIEGSLAPIITSLVMANKKAQTLLDCTSQQNHSYFSDGIKLQLSDILNADELLIDSYMKKTTKEAVSPAMLQIIEKIGYPKQRLKQIHEKIKVFADLLNDQVAEQQIQTERQSENSEIKEVIHEEDNGETEDARTVWQRWVKLEKDLFDEHTNRYNISKVPEIYDTIRHDLRSNKDLLNSIQFDCQEFQELSKLLASFVVPNQYGMNDMEKLATAKDIVLPLIQKILVDLMFWKDKKYEDQYWKYKNSEETDGWKHIRTRLYFTSASHMYSIFNLLLLGCDRQILKYSTPEQIAKAINILKMGYLSHIEFRLYQNLNSTDDNPNRFRLQFYICSEYQQKKEVKEFKLGGNGVTIELFQNFLQSLLNSNKEKDEKQNDSIV